MRLHFATSLHPDFFRQLAWLLSAGIPLREALDNLLLRAGRREAGKIRSIQTGLEGGKGLAETLKEGKWIRRSSECQMLKVHETTGQIDRGLRKLAAMREQRQLRRRELAGQLGYPALLLLATFGVSIFLLYFLIPQFAVTFQRFTGEEALPVATRSLVVMAEWIRHWMPPLVTAGGFLFLVNLAGFYGCRPYRRWLERRWLEWPLLGPAFRDWLAFHLASGLAELTVNGVHLLEAIQILREEERSPLLHARLSLLGEELRDGVELAESLGRTRLFRPAERQLLQVGQASGRLAESFQWMAQALAGTWERRWRRFLACLEPGLLLGLAALILWVALAFFQPMIRMMESIPG